MFDLIWLRSITKSAHAITWRELTSVGINNRRVFMSIRWSMIPKQSGSFAAFAVSSASHSGRIIPFR